jgi:hypothetical protein
VITHAQARLFNGNFEQIAHGIGVNQTALYDWLSAMGLTLFLLWMLPALPLAFPRLPAKISDATKRLLEAGLDARAGRDFAALVGDAARARDVDDGVRSEADPVPGDGKKNAEYLPSHALPLSQRHS